MRKIVLAVCFFCFLLTGCATHRHIIGKGAQVGVSRGQTQWYALYGLIPLGEVDTARLAGGAQDYEIETYYSVGDFLLNNLITGWITVTSRSVKVTK